MGTPTTTAAANSTPTLSGHAAAQSYAPPILQTPPPAATPAPQVISPPAPQQPAPQMQQPAPIATPVPMMATGKQEKIVITPQEGSSKTKQILYVVVAVLFFAAYTIFWMRYFNIIKLPFI